MINNEFQFLCVQYFLSSAKKFTNLDNFFLCDFLLFCPVHLKYKQMPKYEIMWHVLD